MKIELANKKYGIFGIQGSGKTILAKALLKSFRKPIVYRVNDDYDKEKKKVKIWVPEKFASAESLDSFAKDIKELAIKGECDLFNVDEADLYFSSNYHIMPNMNDLVLNHRHYKLAMAFISRRPQDIPTKIVESCHYLFIFKLEGANAMKKFKDIDPKIPPLIEQLDYDKHNFVVKELGRDPYLMKPVAMN